MAIDSSGIVAILMNEAEADILSRVLAGEIWLPISATPFHEASIVMAGKREVQSRAAASFSRSPLWAGTFAQGGAAKSITFRPYICA